MHFTPSPLQSAPTDLPAAESGFDLVPNEEPLVRALESLQGNEHDALRWLEVARAFRSAGQPVQAIDACEACLKIDPKQVDAWFLIAELAMAVGHLQMAEESYEVVRQLAPDDPRLPVSGAGN